MESKPNESTQAELSRPLAVSSGDWLDDDDRYYYDPERDCSHCKGEGKRALLSGIEWDYTGPDYDTCPDCVGTGRW